MAPRNEGKSRLAPFAVCWPHFALLAMVALLSGCAGRSTGAVPQQQTVVAQLDGSTPLRSTLSSRAPVFVLRGTQAAHNRIGRVEASGTQGNETLAINPDVPVVYAETRPFVAENGRYTNLIYRIHFPDLPYSLIPFHLGAGRHVGLLVILTLDAEQRVLLATMAQTCGCYAVSIPTQSMPTARYPDDWPRASFAVYGERLPATLPEFRADDALHVVIREDVHRVMNLEVAARSSLPAETVRRAEMRELAGLKTLPLDDGGRTSWYYSDWPLTGHVKGAIKPWETLLLSLVSLDFFVGMDKEYSGKKESGNRFYTSLKPWNRTDSDMNDFAGYLRFNGWKL